jgi:hypothetical protein
VQRLVLAQHLEAVARGDEAHELQVGLVVLKDVLVGHRGRLGLGRQAVGLRDHRRDLGVLLVGEGE